VSGRGCDGDNFYGPLERGDIVNRKDTFHSVRDKLTVVPTAPSRGRRKLVLSVRSLVPTMGEALASLWGWANVPFGLGVAIGRAGRVTRGRPLSLAHSEELRSLFRARATLSPVSRAVAGLEPTSQQALQRARVVRRTFAGSLAATKRRAPCVQIKLQVVSGPGRGPHPSRLDSRPRGQTWPTLGGGEAEAAVPKTVLWVLWPRPGLVVLK
jgi:hypothetical protein